jgi:TIR domain-containing protein
MLETPRPSQADRFSRLFLCHSSGDKPVVRELYRRLKSDGVDPWFDEEDLFPGQDWEEEITAAVRSCHAIAVCLSQRAITREGYMQKEIRFALDVAEEKPEGTIFIIPVRLELEVEVPNRLRKWQWANLFQDDGYQRLIFILRNPRWRRWQTFSPDAAEWQERSTSEGREP